MLTVEFNNTTSTNVTSCAAMWVITEKIELDVIYALISQTCSTNICIGVNPPWIPIQRHINPGLALLVMIIVSARMWVLDVGAGCLDRDLFQYERQRAMVRGWLLSVLAEALAALVFGAYDLIAGVHQNCHRLSQLHQQPQQT